MPRGPLHEPSDPWHVASGFVPTLAREGAAWEEVGNCAGNRPVNAGTRVDGKADGGGGLPPSAVTPTVPPAPHQASSLMISLAAMASRSRWRAGSEISPST